MIAALVFDCDGVLAETERDGHLVAFNQLFVEAGLGLEWSTREYRCLLQIAGGKERLLSLFEDREWVARHGLPTDRRGQEKVVARWHRRKTEIFMALARAGALRARPGVARLAAEAHAAGWSVAVASTAAERSVQAIVEHVFPARLSQAIRVFAGDIVPRKKPAPDIYLHALAELGRSSSAVCVIEDSRAGLLAARASGAGVIVTPSEFTAGEDFSEAALVVDCLGTGGHPIRVLSSRLPDPPGPMVTLAECQAVMEAQGAAEPPTPAAGRAPQSARGPIHARPDMEDP